MGILFCLGLLLTHEHALMHVQYLMALIMIIAAALLSSRGVQDWRTATTNTTTTATFSLKNSFSDKILCGGLFLIFLWRQWGHAAQLLFVYGLNCSDIALPTQALFRATSSLSILNQSISGYW